MVGVVLIGQSNSGKSAIGKAVAEKLGIRYISSGDIARSMSGIQDRLNSGKMAPEGMMRNAVLRNIVSCNISYILDGFPRFCEQYEWLKNAINHKLIFVFVDVPESDIISRAKLRNRDDDKSIKKKMKYFEENTKPMLRDIMADERLDVYVMDNNNNIDIQTNIDRLSTIVEEYLRC